MENKMSYRMGLDIGIASVGWSVLQINSKDEPIHIIDLGVRTFEKPEEPKTGKSLAVARREARGTRRRLSRRRTRIDAGKKLFADQTGLDIEAFDKKFHSGSIPNVYELRVRALDEEITLDEFAQIMIFFLKHRGFKSSRKADKKDAESGKVLAAIKSSRSIFTEKGYRTIGEMIFNDDLFHTDCPWNSNVKMLTPRNKSESYSRCLLRDDIIDEIKYIFERQRQVGNAFASPELEEKYLLIFSSQRSFDEGPGPMAGGKPNPYSLNGFGEKVGACTFERDQKRAPKGAPSAELFVALQKINNLRIEDKNGGQYKLNEEQRKVLFDRLFSNKKLTYYQVRSWLNIPDEDVFIDLRKLNSNQNIEERLKKERNKAFAMLSCFHELMDAFRIEWKDYSTFEANVDLFDSIAEILSDYKSDENRTKKFIELNISSEIIERLLEIETNGHIHISCKAARKIIPFLIEGYSYDKACEKAGYDYKAENNDERLHILKGDTINEIVNGIANPVVRRSISQTIKVVNAIILKYGSPRAINIELAREMSKNFLERNDISINQKKNEEKNAKAVNDIIHMVKGINDPKGQDILKYNLWVEQNHICMYSGKTIELDDLFKGGYEVDHILPYSRTYMDSFDNKVLVCASENQMKGNRIPYEYFGNDSKRWEEFQARVFMTYHNSTKGKRLLKRQLTKEEMSEFRSRNLNDTRYIARLMYDILYRYLKFEPFMRPEKKKHVTAVNGNITAYLRKRWGLKKDRSIDTHHAQDAVVIACATDGMINQITRYIQARELRYANDLNYVDEETGEIFSPKDYSRDEWDEMFGKKLPYPWPCFKDEIDIRMEKNPDGFLRKNRKVCAKLGYSEELMNCVHPIFVSRMANHKVLGAGHEETVKSAKYFKSENVVVSKTDIKALKLKNDSDGKYFIENYFKPESDRLLYDALLNQLIKCNGNATEAFKEPFHKPRRDGSTGPLVRKVKTYEKMTSGVLVREQKGVAKNGKMIRVDVFFEDGKYYLVPIYTSNTVNRSLPNKACIAHKPMSEWKEMKEENFCFSLFPNDLVCLEIKKGIKTTNGERLENKQMLYFKGMDISAGSNLNCESHQSLYTVRHVGVTSPLYFKKCEVDVLGNIRLVDRENRKGFKK